MEIRRATEVDAQVLGDLERACFADPWPLDAVGRTLDEPTTRAWLAVHGNAPVGYVLATQVLDELTIDRIATLPTARRMGIGKALLHATVDAGRTEGVQLVFLEVRAGNDAAISLYRQAGFEVTRRRKGYYHDGEDALDMRWELP